MCMISGFYLLLNASGSSESDRAVLSLPLPVPAEGQTELCVGFWYYMLGPSVPRLNLLVQSVRLLLLHRAFIYLHLFNCLHF